MPRKPALQTPTPEQLANGKYARRFVNHVESNTEAMVHVSRHDPVERWKAADRLEAHQVAAIELCQSLWNIAGLPIRVTASYGERIPVTGSSERLSNKQIDARNRLYRIMDYFAGLDRWWWVFELICRHGWSAEEAGKLLGFGARSAADRAHTTVCMIASKIAEQEGL